MVSKSISIFVLRRGFLSSLILVLFSLVFVVTDSIASTWSIETVDDLKYFTDFSSRAIAVDTDGYPHIVYGGDHLYYAYYDGNIWHYETIDTSQGVGGYACIVLDTSGKAHISYPSSNGIMYATNASGSWVTELLERDNKAYPSIALDTSGKAHISYPSSNGIMYATNASGSWVTEAVGIDNGAYPSIALDTSGKTHISYYDDEYHKIKYATNAGGTWVTTTIQGDVTNYNPEYSSLAIDTSGKAHVAWEGMYATNASGSWVRTTIGGSNVSLTLDTSDKVHISYYEYAHSSSYYNNLVYATNASGEWVKTTVDSDGDVGKYTSIALDNSDKAHISYYDVTNGDLKYATNASGTWITEVVDDIKYVPHITSRSLAVDADGHPHIVYGGDRLYYAHYDGSWHYETVDSSPGVGWCVSIALDTSGKVHISYYDAKNKYLKYATNTTGIWTTETVYDDMNDVDEEGQDTSIAVDNSGKVHIGFGDVHYGYVNYLMYATKSSGAWETETEFPDQSEDYYDIREGPYASIAVDKSGRVYISYLDREDYIEYAKTHDYYNSVVWKIVKVRLAAGHSGYTSIALDKKGKVHISYIRANRLYYYSSASGKSVELNRGTNRSDLKYTSIAVDASGKAHISYCNTHDPYLGGVRYITNASGEWEKTGFIDAESDCSSIALDTTGKVHICYFDTENYAIKYATYAGCEASSIRVSSAEPEVKVGESIDIVITVEGKNDCLTEGIKVYAASNNKNKVTVSPEEGAIDANGEAVFTITGVKKGSAKVTFTTGKLKKKVKVTVN